MTLLSNSTSSSLETFVPSFAIFPLTKTLPSLIRFSQLLLEPMPAWARNFKKIK
jgi:hypothetical protein